MKLVMKVGIFYQNRLLRRWVEDSELRLFQQALDPMELADRECVRIGHSVNPTAVR